MNVRKAAIVDELTVLSTKVTLSLRFGNRLSQSLDFAFGVTVPYGDETAEEDWEDDERIRRNLVDSSCTSVREGSFVSM